MSYLIYGKRTGKIVDGQPVFDKRFAALDYNGVRVSKLANAGEYATREDAQEVINKPSNQELVKEGLVIYEIRRAKQCILDS